MAKKGIKKGVVCMFWVGILVVLSSQIYADTKFDPVNCTSTEAHEGTSCLAAMNNSVRSPCAAGYYSAALNSVTIYDLNKTVSLSSVGVSATSWTVGGFVSPTAANISISNDSVNWAYCGRWVSQDSANDCTIQKVFPTSCVGRMVAINFTVTGSNGDTRIQEFYFNGTLYGGSGSASYIDINMIAPANTTVNNSNIVNFIYNVSYANLNISLCNLNINSTLYQSNTTAIVNNTYAYFNNVNLVDNTYYWNVNCTATNGTYATAPYNYTLTIDTTTPEIKTNLTNNSFYYRNNITAQINLSDINMIYSYNISIDNVQVLGATSVNSYFYVLNFSYPSSGYAPGMHTISIRYADGHTNEVLMDKEAYEPDTCLFGDCLKYSFKEPYTTGTIQIQQKLGSIFDKWSTEYQKDRYVFNFEPNVASTTYTFVVSADGAIDIIDAPETKYKTWLVFNEHWLDFYPYTDVSMKRISKTQVEVTINNVDSKLDKIAFSSIGDLNIAYLNYTIYVGNYSTGFTNPILELNTDVFYLNISRNTTFVDDINAVFYYNNTNYSIATKTSDDNYFYFSTNTINMPLVETSKNISIIWSLNISSPLINSTIINITDNQYVIKFNITNCTTLSTNQTLVIRYFDFANTTKIYSTAAGIITVTTPSGIKQNFSLVYANNTNATFCLYPNNTAFSIDADVYFNIPPVDYNAQNFVQNGLILNFTRQIFDIYFTPSGTTSEITTNIVDSYNQQLIGYTVYAYKYDLGTGNYLLMGSEKTDSNGQAKFNLIVSGGRQYQFVVKNPDGISVYTSETSVLFSTSYTFRVVTASNAGDVLQNLIGFTCPLAYDSSTKLATASYNDHSNIGYVYYLSLYNTTNITISSNQLINTTSSLLAATTLSMYVPDNTSSYNLKFIITASLDNSNYTICDLPIINTQAYQILGDEDSLIAGILFIGTITLLGITIGAEIAFIFMIVGVLAMAWLGFINFGVVIGGVVNIIILLVIFIIKLYRRGY